MKFPTSRTDESGRRDAETQRRSSLFSPRLCASASILVLSLLLLSSASAETRQEKGKRIVDQALEALGGNAFLQMQDRIEFGRAYSFYRREINGLSLAHIYTRYLTAPNPPIPGDLEVRERQTFGKDESDIILLTEKQGWEITFRGARPVEDRQYDNFKDSTLKNFFYILRQRLNEPGLTFYAQDSDFYENRPVDIVDITDADNNTVTVTFDQLSHLPVKQSFRRRNPDYHDFDTEVTIWAKFRDVGNGVKWPFDTRRERNGEKIFELYSDSVVINQDLKDNLFTLPGNVKLLPKPK